MLFNVWIQSKEARLRIAVVEALGIMSQLLTKEKLELVWWLLVIFLNFTVAVLQN